MPAQSEIDKASDLLARGKFLDCAAICASLVSREPRNAVAAHMFGLALKGCGDVQQGEQWMRASIELEPTRSEFHSNLGNLLRRREKYKQAIRFYKRAVELAPENHPARRSLALTLNDVGKSSESEAMCRELLSVDATDVETWVVLALALGSMGRLAECEQAYRQALDLQPDHGIALHNLGALLSRLDKPEAALLALNTAGASGETGYEMAFNRARALWDLNDLAGAEREFAFAAGLRPLDPEVHLQLARVRFARGDPQFARSLAKDAGANRDHLPLQLLFAEVLWRAGNLNAAEALLRDLLLRKGPSPLVQVALASVLQEQGSLADAETHAVAAATGAPDDAVVIETLVSILLCRGRARDAWPFIRTHRQRMPKAQSWIAYEATAARVLGEDAYPHLYDYDRLIKTFEVETPAGWSSMAELNNALRETLGERHKTSRHPLDQSLRNGTQSSRSLLTDPDPAIVAILRAFKEPIAEYSDQLGADALHPMSARNSTKLEFTGAWSVRLRQLGYHVNHFHPDGWISSAYYVDVPAETMDRTAKSGWIKFGEPRHAVPGVYAERFIQPKAGRLVLFPSYMWHGTNAINGDAPRLSIAFDVKPS